MLNFLFVYSSGCHQAAQRGFAGPSEGMGKSVCLAFLGWALGSAGSVDLEVSLTSAEVGAWAYPLTSARAKFKSLMAEMSPVVTQWWVWKGMREKKKGKKNPTTTKKGKNQGEREHSYDMSKMEKTRLTGSQQFRTWPGGAPKALCPCSQLGDVWGACTSPAAWLRSRLLSQAFELFREAKGLLLCECKVPRRGRSQSLAETSKRSKRQLILKICFLGQGLTWPYILSWSTVSAILFLHERAEPRNFQEERFMYLPWKKHQFLYYMNLDCFMLQK